MYNLPQDAVPFNDSNRWVGVSTSECFSHLSFFFLAVSCVHNKYTGLYSVLCAGKYVFLLVPLHVEVN